MPGRDDVRPNPIAGNHREIIRQARVPDSMVVRRDVVGVRERLDLRSLGIVENADATEARKPVVIFEHDYERVIEPRSSVHGHGREQGLARQTCLPQAPG